MTMIFTSNWNKPKLAVIPDEASLIVMRQGLSGNKQKKAGIHPKQIEYAKDNNAKREAGVIFLTMFNETNVRNAVQKASESFNHQAVIKDLFAKMIGSSETVTIDQGTHQVEDVDSGGFKLHFDARRPSDNLCFHLYVGQNSDGSLKIIEVSFINNGVKVEAHPS